MILLSPRKAHTKSFTIKLTLIGRREARLQHADRLCTGEHQGQRPDLQENALREAGYERIYTDHASGAKASRPQLDRMLDALRPGDTVVVRKLDRLGRSLQDLVALMDRFREMDVGFRCTTQQIDTTTPGGVLVFNIFAAMAQFDLDLISAQTNAGLSTARKRPSPSSLPPSRRTSAPADGARAMGWT